jgi:hypothetical protein
LVPVESAFLAGAEQQVVDDVVHSRKYGRDWYGGSQEIIRQWWPQDLSDADPL